MKSRKRGAASSKSAKTVTIEPSDKVSRSCVQSST